MYKTCFFINKSLTYIRKTHKRDFRYGNFKWSFVRLSSQKVIVSCMGWLLLVWGGGLDEGGGGLDRQLLLSLRTVAAGLSKSLLSNNTSQQALQHCLLAANIFHFKIILSSASGPAVCDILFNCRILSYLYRNILFLKQV